jgi:phage head maturation protease
MAQKISTEQLSSEAAAKAAGLTVFRFFTDPKIAAKALPVVTKENGGDGLPRIVLTASTSARDLVGDTFTRRALEKMRDAAPGTTIFLNHEKKVPYDVLGAVEKADLREEGGVIHLDYTILADLTTDQAQKTYAQIEKGIVKLGASVTVAVLDKQKQASGPGDVIDDIYYLECSVVGIPANPKCFVQYARKALDTSPTDTTDQDSTVVDAPPSGAPTEKHHSLTTTKTGAVGGGEARTSVPSPSAALVEKLKAEEIKPGTNPTTIYQKGKLLELGLAYLKSCGLFNEEQARRKPSPYELFDIFTTVRYRLWRLRQANLSAGVVDDFDYRTALEETIVEYGNALLESVLSEFGLDQPSAVEVSSYSLKLLTGLDLLLVSKSVDGADVGDDGEAASATQMAQSVHDITTGLGAKCCGVEGKSVVAEALAASQTDGAGELTAKNLQLVEKVAALEAERNSATTETATWKASAYAAVKALEDFGAQPLTLPGA